MGTGSVDGPCGALILMPMHKTSKTNVSFIKKRESKSKRKTL